ncbi:MAG TPA: outer membrane protein assembly factor BamB [Methylibium sp.]|uniref:outer membrane protein assembly factor BamB n=1 Tax=Methylibium sp. TaxID=2067992 RepID=UPI002DBB3575|nr:outer membrane protein assembly factor BamB [Methylibium sp.]HEU4460227.1 outer membrane protein assembly factor BamB [Methylibium sp.]
MKRLLCAAAAALALVACSSNEKPKPTPLVAYTAGIAATQAWRASVGEGGPALRVAATPQALVFASSSGRIEALAPDSGKELWRGETDGKLAAGVGSDGRWAAVVTTANELVVLERGKPAWRTRLSTRVVTAPLVAGERVFVLGIDRSLQAFDAQDGRKLWGQQRAGDPLTLLQPGVLLPWNDTLIAGQGPRLAGFDPLRGSLRWETTVASPRGTNEVERLADLVGPAARVGTTVCARGFQAAVGCVDAGNGSLAWSRTVGGTRGVAADEDMVFAADATDRISAWKRSTGDVVWASDALLYRELSSPLVAAKVVVFGDLEGQVHFLDRENGTTLLRLPTDGSAVTAPPVRVGNTIVVVTRRGGVFAFRLS